MAKSDPANKKQIGINFTEPLYNAVKAVAEFEDRSFSNMVRIWCIEGLERRQQEERKRRLEAQQLKQRQEKQPIEQPEEIRKK